MQECALTIVVLACTDAAAPENHPLPAILSEYPVKSVPARTDKSTIDSAARSLDGQDDARLVVVGDDTHLAAVLTRLMLTERLHITVGYVSAKPSTATRIYGLATGEAAARRALEQPSVELPLIRDDTGAVLVGHAVWSAKEGDAGLVGEAIVDDYVLFDGEVRTTIDVEPLPEAPGVRARLTRGRLGLPGRWRSGRAVQFGTPGARLTRDGVGAPRLVTRSTFYRYHEPWRLAR